MAQSFSPQQTRHLHLLGGQAELGMLVRYSLRLGLLHPLLCRFIPLTHTDPDLP